VAVILDYATMDGALSMRDVIDLLECALTHEAAGDTDVSQKYITEFAGGAMRMLVAADHAAGYLATKAYHSIDAAGVRYVVTLYRLQDGELLAWLDGQLITDLRTGGASGVIARKVPLAGAVTVGVLGSGNQARMQLESLAAVYTVTAASVWSPTAANRETYAREMSQKLGITVTAAASAEAAVRGHPVVAVASSARLKDPLLRGEWLAGCRLLCAVGNTRKQFAEADARCFGDAALVVADSPHAQHETGDLIQAIAAGVLPPQKLTTLAAVVTGQTAVPATGMIVFKSVGTALQDVALAGRYYELLGARAGLAGVASFPRMR
jgi:ornithine cyclodeaminase/alanine dehydrogenase-like protein (mu-crystallin family)